MSFSIINRISKRQFDRRCFYSPIEEKQDHRALLDCKLIVGVENTATCSRADASTQWPGFYKDDSL